jgi:hypothetical protein
MVSVLAKELVEATDLVCTLIVEGVVENPLLKLIVVTGVATKTEVLGTSA